MHVGHLRSTIIGDSLCRFFENAGHEVLRVNHVGDWGTQFGMLLEYLRVRETQTGQDTFAYLNTLSLTDLTELYKASKKEFDADGTQEHPGDPEFKNKARKMVVALQSGKDEHARKVWQKLVEVSKRGFDRIYSILNISFESQTKLPGTGYCGESFYQDKIDDAIKSLGKLVQKRGEALLMFTGLQEAKQEPTPDHPDGEIPLFLRKSDGGFGYDSTDVAAVKFRIQELKADRVLYVTDAGQQTHFHMVFEAARQAGWSTKTKLNHVKFGLVLAKGGGKFKTRSGETVTLESLLQGARQKMREILLERMKQEKSTTGQFDQEKVETLSAAIGAAAVKYFDLRTNRTRDYEFDEDLMCSPDGDTAVYLMYAYARVCSIIDKATEASINNVVGYKAEGASDRERSVAMLLSRFNDVVDACLLTLSPHPLCGYLYSLASELSTFLTDDAERVWAKRAADSTEALQLEPKRGMHRLFLVRGVRSVLFEGLGLLGITPFERM
jgi:arginyl-tRNA synthetase